MQLTKDNLLVYAAQNYYNPKCIDSDEFLEDLKRFKYIKRLLNRYRDTGQLSERLILLTDVEGVLDKKGNLLREISIKDAKKLIKN